MGYVTPLEVPMAGNWVNEDGEYIIPVQWSMYSTVKVKNASNLKEAFDIVYNLLNDIPIESDGEYIDGSYTINAGDDQDLIDAQSFKHVGKYEIDANTKKIIERS